MASPSNANRWLSENGPKELELLFRAIVYHPSVPILLTDDERQFREASIGASRFFGLPREKVIGRRLDDFSAHDFKPVISERWSKFLEQGEQEGTNSPAGCGRKTERGGVLRQN